MDATVELAPDVVVGGRYRLIAPLAKGGTASVWRAVDVRLDREVALKVLEDDSIDPQLRSRAEREAKVLASVSHPNIVRVLDSGEDDGRPFLVMDLLHGSSLHAILAERGRLGVEEAVRLVADLAEGLGVAHDAGVIHRDVKPANIMCAGDVPTLVDFGIARHTDATDVTKGLVLGTASYLAPEQAQGLPVTAAADVYGLGCVLHELLTGVPPFEGDSPVAIAFKQVHDEPSPPSAREASIPLPVDAVVLRCLAKDPTARPANGAALAAELRRALTPDADATMAVAAIAAPGPATSVLPADLAVAAAPAPPLPPASASAAASGTGRWKLLVGLGVAALALVLWRTTAGGDDGAVVPELIGSTEADARTELRAEGLQADVFEVDSDRAAGTVVMTGPGPGQAVEDGSTVRVAVSNGSDAPLAEAPPVDASADVEIEATEPPAPQPQPEPGHGQGRGKEEKGEKDDDDDDD